MNMIHYLNEINQAIEKAIERYFTNNRELNTRRIINNKELDVQTSKVRMRQTVDSNGNGKIVFERLDSDTV
jgi:peptidyl-tRNA hydrolase